MCSHYMKKMYSEYREKVSCYSLVLLMLSLYLTKMAQLLVDLKTVNMLCQGVIKTAYHPFKLGEN